MLGKSDVTRGKWMIAAALVVAIAGARADGAELNTLRDVQVLQTGTGAQVVVSGTRPPTFTVFRLSGPERLVVDLSSADATGIKGHHEGSGPVTGIVASQFSDERASVASSRTRGRVRRVAGSSREQGVGSGQSFSPSRLKPGASVSRGLRRTPATAGELGACLT